MDALPVYRNGYGKPRKLTTPLGTVTLRRPRVRGVGGALCEPDPAAICPEDLGGRGAVPARIERRGNFDVALRGLLGEDSPLSASTVARLKEP